MGKKYRGFRTTDTRSTTFDTAARRVRFCTRYVLMFSPPSDAAFHILYRAVGRDTASGGPEWDMRVAVRVDPADAGDWAVGDPTPAAGVDLSWVRQLQAENPGWDVASPPEVSVRPDSGAVIVVHRPEGVVFKRTFNVP